MHTKEYYTARKKTPCKMGKSREYDAEQKKPDANEHVLCDAIDVVLCPSLGRKRNVECVFKQKSQ